MTRRTSPSRASRWLLGTGLVLPLVGGNVPARGQAVPDPASPRARASLSERRGVAPAPAEAKGAGEPTGATPPAPAGEEAKPEAPGSGFLGDTRKFTRLGGWGSMGNVMGQFGVAKSMLAMMPPVQEELKLTDGQKEKLRQVQEATRRRGEEMARTLREEGGDPTRGGEDASIVARATQFTGMIDRFGGLLRENDAGLDRVLDAAQRKRLNQIALQMEGVSALTRPEMAEALGLFPEQVEEIRQVVARSRMMQMTSLVGTMMALRANRPATRDPATAKDSNADKDGSKVAAARPAPAEDTSDPGGRSGREQSARERFARMRDDNDRIQDRATRQITQVLTKAQRARFTNMLGPPFDPQRINALGRPPRPTGPKPASPERSANRDAAGER